MGETGPMRAPRPRTIRTLSVLAVLLIAVVAAGVWFQSGQHPRSGDTAQQPPDQQKAVVGEAGTCGGKPVVAQRELRGMWLTTVLNIDWPSQPGLSEQQVKAEYLGWLDVAQRQNHNAIYVHVRPSGDAFWPSKFAPWSEWLTGKRDGASPGWDPMEWMVAETHKRNIEFHAWFNPYRGTQPAPKGPGADIDKLAPNHPLRAHPDWVIAYPAGTSSSRLYFDPGIPAARTFVEDSMLEAVERYDIDGVSFDDFFYPYPEGGGNAFNDDASYATYGKNFASKGDWRRDNVNTMIREMNQRIKALKPWVKFSISPFGIWRNQATDPTGSDTRGLQSYDEIYADTKTWVKQRWIDAILPQLYWQIGFDRADYAKLLPWWSEVVKGTGVQLYIAQGDYRVGEAGAWSDPAELDRQMVLNRQYPVQGTVHFSAKSVRDDALGAISLYAKNQYARPALMPLMAQLPVAVPATPSVSTVRREADGSVTVSWRPGEGTAATSFAVYRLDGAESAQLVASVRATGGEQSFVDKGASPTARYCVSALDRTWNESRLTLPAP
jgi:uncharacterized lipoprotein YddW (UPF0748 family)